jgi:class 3 adenylate cyclase/tetratricopeptide (TPR) repeat protein
MNTASSSENPRSSAHADAMALAMTLPQKQKVVLVADLVGSVSLMQRAEVGVIHSWESFIQHVTHDVLPERKGRMVKSLGDGLMAEFDSAQDAAAAALAMHRWIQRVSPQDRPMRLRIGLNASLVYEGEHDIYGTGVNLSARIAALALPGSTVMTPSVSDALIDGLDGELEDLGPWYLKHVDEPVHVYGLRAAGDPTPAWSAPADARPICPGIAVVPFRSRQASSEHFAVGDLIAEGVIGQLGRTPTLKIISHLSTSAFQSSSRSLGEAETYLGADYVLSGSYVVTGDTILVISELTEVARNEIAWTGRHTAPVADLLELHSEICNSIACGCHLALLDREAQQALVRPLPTLQSYSLLLGGIRLMHRSDPQQFMRTREVLDALVERHGNHALPRVWLAKWYVLCSTRGLSNNPQVEAKLALQETRRALDAEPGHPLAWAMQGFVYCHLLKDIDRALHSSEQALQSNCNESLAWLFKAMILAFDGQGALAWPAGQKALELSPLDPLKYYYHSLMASIAISAGKYPAAIGFAQNSLRINAGHLSSYRALVMAQALAGQVDAARHTLGLLMQRDPGFTVARFEQGYPSRERVPAYLEQLKDALRAAGAKEH